MKRSWIKRSNKPLKRSGFNVDKKSYTTLKGFKIPLKRSKLRKTSKVPISRLQRQIWQLCKEIIRRRHGNSCYTCGQTNLSGMNWHTGHLWAKASLGAWLKYDLRVLRPQCYNCNINHGGAGAEFWVRMVRDMGQEYMDNLKAERHIEVRAYEHYSEILDEYKKIYSSYEK